MSAEEAVPTIAEFAAATNYDESKLQTRQFWHISQQMRLRDKACKAEQIDQHILCQLYCQDGFHQFARSRMLYRVTEVSSNTCKQALI